MDQCVPRSTYAGLRRTKRLLDIILDPFTIHILTQNSGALSRFFMCEFFLALPTSLNTLQGPSTTSLSCLAVSSRIYLSQSFRVRSCCCLTTAHISETYTAPESGLVVILVGPAARRLQRLQHRVGVLQPDSVDSSDT